MLRRTRLPLVGALALSLLVHLALLPLVHSGTEPQPDETAPPTIRIDPRPTPPPTPRPTPTPVPTPRATPRPRRALQQPQQRPIRLTQQAARPHGRPAQPHEPALLAPPQNPADGQIGNSSAGTDGVAGTATPTAIPAAPTAIPATPPPACAQPNVDAATLDAVAPETPPIAAQQGISGDVTVIVSLDETSRVIGARVLSSPSALLNDAALRAARASRYRTEIRNCRPIAADYAFIVEFTNQ